MVVKMNGLGKGVQGKESKKYLVNKAVRVRNVESLYKR